MKVIYKPFGIALGLIAGMLGKRAFDVVWKHVDEEKPPKSREALLLIEEAQKMNPPLRPDLFGNRLAQRKAAIQPATSQPVQ